MKVWKKVLKVLYLNGDKMNSKEIEEITEISHDVIYMTCKRLIQWEYIKKETREFRINRVPYFYRVNYYWINKNKKERIKEIITNEND